MAIPSDSAKPLIDQFVAAVRRWNDAAAVVGVACVTVVALKLSRSIFRAVRVNGLELVSRADRLKRTYGQRVMVTGCTRGLGLSFCEEMARRGHDLVMISQGSRVHDIGEHIAAKYGVQVSVVGALVTAVGARFAPRVWERRLGA